MSLKTLEEGREYPQGQLFSTQGREITVCFTPGQCTGQGASCMCQSFPQLPNPDPDQLQNELLERKLGKNKETWPKKLLKEENSQRCSCF